MKSVLRRSLLLRDLDGCRETCAVMGVNMAVQRGR